MTCLVCGRDTQDMRICHRCRHHTTMHLHELPDLHALLPAINQPTTNVNQRVTGTPEMWPTPINLDAHDLQLPANQHSRTLYARGLLGLDEDQVGTLSVATILDTWVLLWRELRNARETLPEPTVPVLASWLRIRIDWAADHLDQYDDFADEIRDTTTHLRSLLALQCRRETFHAACPTCDTRSLYRTIDPARGASSYIKCGHCGRLWTEDEYARLAAILIAEDARQTAHQPSEGEPQCQHQQTRCSCTATTSAATKMGG